MNPYMNPRGQGPGSYSQSNYSFTSNLFDQNVFNEFNQGSRLNVQGNLGNQRIPYHSNINNERNVAPYPGNQAGNQYQYDRYLPSNFPSSNSPLVDNSLNFDTHHDRLAGTYNQDRNNQLGLSDQVEANIGDRGFGNKVMNDKSNYEESAKNFEYCMDMINESDKNYHENEKTGARNKIQSEEVEVKNVIDIGNESTTLNESIETAVDLSTGTSGEKEAVDQEKETPNIKEEKNEEAETIESEAETSDTITDEPVKKKKKVLKKKKEKKEKSDEKKKEKKEKSDETYKCKDCDKVYSNPDSFRKHQNYHAGLFKCKICDRSCNSNFSLLQHEKVHTGVREGNLCGICGKTFSDTSSLNKHHKSVHEKLTYFSCETCDLKFYARKTYDEHIRVHTGERPYKCNLCPKTYKRISDLNHHIRGHTGETKHMCELCGKGVRRLSELKIHMNAHRQKGELLNSSSSKKASIICRYCGKMFMRKQDLERHMKHCKEITTTGLDTSEHDSLLIAAAIDSEMHKTEADTFEAVPLNRTMFDKETISESEMYYYEQMRKLYQHASIKPQRTDNLKFNLQMPISDASFHAYFPIPEEEKREVENKETDKNSPEQKPGKSVNNWLSAQFNSQSETSQNKLNSSVPDISVGKKAEVAEIEVASDIASNNKQTKLITSNSEGGDLNDSEKQGSGSIFNTKTESDSSDVNEKNSQNCAKVLCGEKQKNIATVLDKLAEKKSKNVTSSEPLSRVKIKMEVSDGDETDDYELECFSPLEDKSAEPPEMKKLKKEKVTKSKGKKNASKAKPKTKSGVKRQRKRIPKKLQKKSPKLNKIDENNDSNLDNASVKIENVSDEDEFQTSVKNDLKDGMYMCSKCHKTFKTRQAFRTHKLMHTGIFTCTECNKSLSSSWSLKAHMLTHSSSEQREKFPCDVCGKSFCDKSTVNKHIRAVHMNYKPFKCTECDLMFSERKTLAEHMRTHTGERPFLCAYCPKTFKRVSELNHHIRGHTGETKHTCEQCGRGFRRQSELQRHVTSHTGAKPHWCGVCGKEFRSASSMHEHTRRHYGDTGKHGCHRCGKHFFKRSKLERHMKSYKFCTTKCRYCMIEIEDHIERKKHEETHDGALKYVCHTCGKSFRGKGPLNKHLRIHTGERPYVCRHCQATFIQSNHLKQHERKHTGDRPYHCMTCGKYFAQSGTLQAHLKTHLSEEPPDLNQPAPVLREMETYNSDDDSEDSMENDTKVLEAVKSAMDMIRT